MELRVCHKMLADDEQPDSDGSTARDVAKRI